VNEFTIPLGLAGAAVCALFVVELVLLARFLGWGRRAPADPRATVPAWIWVAPLVVGIAIALPALGLVKSGGLAPGVSGAGMPWEAVTDSTPAATSAAWGERAYLNRCAPCHLPEGQGLPPSYPPLAGSAVLQGPADAHVRMVLWGSAGLARRRPGAAAMPAFAGAASDAELAAILTYERRTWAPGAPAVLPSDVRRARGEGTPAP
jgi:cytochrome c oxidase subunit 2